ncbi:MAG: CBS domain-containing protein [Deltaproteobacteria bacterium]|nr:CBS domain-containing protein [Deltaproteobacteria bacterium]
MKLKSLMTSDVKCCAIDDTLSTAAQIMWDNDVGAVPVVDEEGRICGMVTDRDICMTAYLRGILLTGAAVSTAMAKPVFSCSPEDDVHDAEKLMREKQLRRLPIVDAHGRVAGIISIADIARWTQQETRVPTEAELTRVMASVCARRR